MSRWVRVTILVGLLALAACTPRSLYATGQVWQRKNCSEIEDSQRRLQCLNSASASYEQYEHSRK